MLELTVIGNRSFGSTCICNSNFGANEYGAAAERQSFRAITANKVKGIRAAQRHDAYSAERARKSNDAQIITMGGRVIGPELAKTILHTFLLFQGGASAPKVERIKAHENGAA